MSSTKQILALAVFLQLAVTAVLSVSDRIFTLKVDVHPNAVQNIKEQMLSLIISRGFRNTTGFHQFNTAWITESYGNLLAGTLVYNWRQRNRAAFVDETAFFGSIIREQRTTTSPTFSPGDSVTFNGSQWSTPTAGVDPPNIEVKYAVSTNALNVVLKAPYIANGNEEWSAYYYSEPKMANSALIGRPSNTLALKLGVGIQQEAFIGSITGDELFIRYGDSVSKSACIRTPAGKKTVELRSGRCV